MELMGYIVLAIVLLFALFQLWVLLAPRSQVGKPLPELHGLLEEKLLQRERLLFYFYSEQCGPCRAMAPQIERLHSEYEHLIRVNVAEEPALARAFSVMGTPTFVRVTNGVIDKVHVGALSAAKLQQLAQSAE